MLLTFTGAYESFRAGILALSDTLGITAAFDGTDGLVVEVRKGLRDKLTVKLKNSRATIAYDKRIHFFRALGLLVEQLKAGSTQFSKTEDIYFLTNGPMFDVSQGNAVINNESVKELLRRMALMGLNMLMLYCEDSYKVPEEPWFGYMRGKYTEEDLRALDDYADQFGIEMIPCIQTLAHLPDTLRWSVYKDIKEDNECLFVGEEKTYTFIRHLLEAASRPFRTKRIHIGMDEAWRLGLGSYLEKHGLVSKTEIMRIHLARVMEIIRELGLKPMMWSDMFFRAIDPQGKYYNETLEIPEESVNAVPDGMQLVYWDYYHHKASEYDCFIEKHRKFGEPIFAGGIWTWLGYGANWPKTFNTSYPALMTCKRKGVREVFVTIWGDNGTECNIFANLPGLQYFAEHGYNADPSEAEIAARFNFCCGADWNDFLLMTRIDKIPSIENSIEEPYNCSKFLMWQDVLTGLLDKNIKGLPINAHYEKLAEEFKDAIGRNGAYDRLFEYNYNVANVLALKSELGLQLTKAYRDDDRDTLTELLTHTLPELTERVKALRKCHKKLWWKTYQPFGWDIMDLRYGGLLIRLQSTSEQLTAYLAGDPDALLELGEPRLPYNGIEGIPLYTNYYGDLVSPSRTAPKA